MAITGIFFGSDTGNTENIAKMIQKQLGKDVADVHDIAKSSKEDLEAYDILLLGIPTWYYGEAQCDWDDFFPTLEEIDFNGKLVALFGCGDQEDYAEYFCDALGTIRDIIEPRGATIVGHWPLLCVFIRKQKFTHCANLVFNRFDRLRFDDSR